MDFVVLERSNYLPFGFSLNDCMKKSCSHPSECLEWLIPEGCNRCGFGCLSGRGLLSMPWFLTPGNKLLSPKSLPTVGDTPLWQMQLMGRYQQDPPRITDLFTGFMDQQLCHSHIRRDVPLAPPSPASPAAGAHLD